MSTAAPQLAAPEARRSPGPWRTAGADRLGPRGAAGAGGGRRGRVLGARWAAPVARPHPPT
ncbi:hypothetical protein ACFXC1_28120, partial [Streptomyces hokutonensis]